MRSDTTRETTGAPACGRRLAGRARLPLHALAITLVAFGAFADTSQQAASGEAKPAASSAPQDLVEAARANKAKRKKSTTKVITNADVKKAKSKLLDSGAPATPVAHQPSMLEKHASEKAARADADATRAATEELIGELEAELAALEQSYYDENDLNRRDTELVKRFNDVKAKLDAARSALAQIP